MMGGPAARSRTGSWPQGTVLQRPVWDGRGAHIEINTALTEARDKTSTDRNVSLK